ncbi:MAG: transposase [Aeromicrobium sp.]|uniref:IS110 family transposase n=1 Tax=Aeromicrobium sp. TaxID=1871063 RepID=UPI0039E2AA39
MAITPATTTTEVVVAGVDTHADTHVVAVLTTGGRLLSTGAFPTTTDGYQALLDFVASHGLIEKFGIELTGSYGAGLTRFLRAEGIDVVDVDIAHPYDVPAKAKTTGSTPNKPPGK